MTVGTFTVSHTRDEGGRHAAVYDLEESGRQIPPGQGLGRSKGREQGEVRLESKSYIATPPGATIKEQLDDRGMTQKEFASRMGLSEKHVSKLMNGDVHLTPEMAERLELVLGLPARFWNNLEAIYQEKLVKAKKELE